MKMHIHVEKMNGMASSKAGGHTGVVAVRMLEGLYANHLLDPCL